MSLLKLLFLLAHLMALAGVVTLLPKLATRLSRERFVVLVAVLGFGFAAVVFLFSEPPKLFSDFYKAYYPAALHVAEGREEAYRALIVSRDFVNLPGVAWLFVPLVPMGVPWAGFSFLVLGIGSSLLAWWWLVRVAGLDVGGAGVLFVLFAGNGPLINSLREGNTSHVALAGIVGALLLLRRGRDGAAGFVIGLCAVVKLPLLALGAYFLLAGRWRAFAGGLLSVGGVALLSVLSFGWELQLLWFESGIHPFLGHPILAFNSQSLPALFGRLFSAQPALRNWDPSVGGGLATSLTQLSVIVVVLAIVGSSLARSLGMRSRGRGVEPHVVKELELCSVLVAALLVTALAWTHYYLWLLVPFALFLGSEGHFSSNPWTKRAMWCGLFLSSPAVKVFDIETPWIRAIYTRLGVSHVVLGGTLVFFALVWARFSARIEPRSPVS